MFYLLGLAWVELSTLTATLVVGVAAGVALARKRKSTPAPTQSSRAAVEAGRAILVRLLCVRLRAMADAVPAEKLAKLDLLLDDAFSNLADLDVSDTADRRVIEELDELTKGHDAESVIGQAEAVHELVRMRSLPSRSSVEGTMPKESLDRVRSLALVQRELDLSRLTKGCLVATEDELFSVEGVTRYEERYGGRLYTMPEFLLRSLLDGRSSSLAIESDDELRIDVQVERLRLTELGLDNADLVRMDDEEEGAFTFRGQRFEYADSGEAKLVSEEGEQPLYYWDFDATDGSHRVSVERYDAAPEVYLMRRVLPQKLEAFSVRR